jgi:hypothetical protein
VCSQNKHEIVRHLVFANVAELALAMTVEQNDYLYAKIRSLAPELVDEPYVQLLKTFSMNALSAALLVRRPVFTTLRVSIDLVA